MPLCCVRSQGVPLRPDIRRAVGSNVQEFTESVVRLCACAYGEFRNIFIVYNTPKPYSNREGLYPETPKPLNWRIYLHL